MTDIYVCKFFNEFVKGEIKNDFVKRVIVNEMTGSSWRLNVLKESVILSPISIKNLLSLAKKRSTWST